MTELDWYFFEGLKRGDSKVIKEIIRKFRAITISYVRQNNGSKEDGEEFLVVTITEIWNWLNKPGNVPGNEERHGFEPFYRQILRNQWLNEIKKRKGVSLTIDIADEQVDNDCDDYCYQLFQVCFQNLGNRCKDSLELYLQGIPGTEAWKILGFPAQNTLNQHNFSCRQQIVQCISDSNNDTACKCIPSKN